MSAVRMGGSGPVKLKSCLHSLTPRQVLRHGLSKHKKACKKDAAELQDEELFNSGHSSTYGTSLIDLFVRSEYLYVYSKAIQEVKPTDGVSQ